MKRRPLLLFTVLFLLFVTFLSVRFWRRIQQDRADLALMTAVQKESAQDVLVALHQGADPNARERDEPPHGWHTVLQRILHPSSPSLSNTALMVASAQGDAEIVLELLAANAQVNAVNDKGECALTTALDAAHGDIMFLLLSHGANPNVKASDGGERPIPIVIRTLQGASGGQFGDTDCRTLMERFLDKGADRNAVDSEGNTLLLTALGRYDPETVTWLILHGADVDRPNQNGKTPLQSSAYDSVQPNITRLLLDRGANVTLAHNGGWNLLCRAAETDDLLLAQKAIKRGLGIDSRDKRGRTPLMYAAVNDARHVFNLLLALGADVNAFDGKGWTALMFAAQDNDLYYVDALLRHGANRRLRDREDHWTAEERAIHAGQEPVADLLRTGRRIRKQEAKSEPNLFLRKYIRPNLPKSAIVDAHRRLEAVHVREQPKAQGGDHLILDEFEVVVVQDDGKRGKPFGKQKMFDPHGAQIFHDTDGLSYVFIQGGVWIQTACIAAVRGLTLVQKCDCSAASGASCQPLPGGGALVLGFTPSRVKETLLPGLPLAHEHDFVAKVSRFRQGKLTQLGFVCFPQQEEPE